MEEHHVHTEYFFPRIDNSFYYHDRYFDIHYPRDRNFRRAEGAPLRQQFEGKRIMAIIKPWQVIATTTPQNIYGNTSKVKREDLPRPAQPTLSDNDLRYYILQLESHITIDASGKREAGKSIALPVAWYEFYIVCNFTAALQLAPDMAKQIPIATRNHLDCIESAAANGKFDASAMRYAIDNASGVYDKNRQNRAASVRILVRQADGTDKGSCLPHSLRELFGILWNRGFMPSDCNAALRLLDKDGKLIDNSAPDDLDKLRELQAEGNDADHICAAFSGITNADRKLSLDKERAKHLGAPEDANSDDDTDAERRTDATTPTRAQSLQSEVATTSIDRQGVERAAEPTKPATVRKRDKSTNKGSIASY